MNKTTIYEQLEEHYKKLCARLQKAHSKGQSRSIQQRLLGRIERCSMQLKQIGAGVTVLAALGWSAPAFGQMYPYEFTQRTGTSNPFDTMTYNGTIEEIRFVDIDGDNDKDAFMTRHHPYARPDNLKFLYYENIGGGRPLYVQRLGRYNPLDTVLNRTSTSFVDIDGDGDLDLFASDDYYYTDTTTSAALDYYENVGSSISPVFVLRTGTANPLNEAVTYVRGMNTSLRTNIISSFVDIDGDGDLDCFVTPSRRYRGGFPTNLNSDRILYYKNEGNVNTPNFQRQTAANNPLNNLAMAIPNGATVRKNLIFMDGERIPGDGDMDLLAFVGVEYSGMLKGLYYENTGSTTSPVFVARTTSPLDRLNTDLASGEDFLGMGDLTADAQPEVVEWRNGKILYFENTTVININKVPSITVLQVYPNPSTGWVQLESPVTGEVKLYNAIGQAVFVEEVEEVQALDFSSVARGVYWLQISSKDKDYQQTIYLQK